MYLLLILLIRELLHFRQNKINANKVLVIQCGGSEALQAKESKLVADIACRKGGEGIVRVVCSGGNDIEL